MRITVIRNDKTIGINGIFFENCDLSFLANNVHVIQINDDHKEVEYSDRNNDNNIDQSIIDQIVAEFEKRKTEADNFANFLKQDDSGNWIQDIDRKWENVRAERNKRISETDWRMTVDYSGSDQEEWKIYRQELRSITEQPDPFGIVWPEIPSL